MYTEKKQGFRAAKVAPIDLTFLVFTVNPLTITTISASFFLMLYLGPSSNLQMQLLWRR